MKIQGLILMKSKFKIIFSSKSDRENVIKSEDTKLFERNCPCIVFSDINFSSSVFKK